MDYRFFESVERSEIAKEDITLKQYYGDINPETRTRKVHTDLKETGSALTAHYYMQGKYEMDNRLTDEQIFAITNAVKALMLLKGEESIDEQLITKFVKKVTGIKIKNFRIDIATKTYSYTYRGGVTYESNEIDLKHHVNYKPLI